MTDKKVGNYFRLVKSLDIAYITILYVLTAYLTTLIIEKVGEFLFTTGAQNKSRERLLYEITFQVSITGIASYWGRNLIVMIPSPFHGVSGLDHYRIKELNSGGVLMAISLAFQKDLQNKIIQLRELL